MKYSPAAVLGRSRLLNQYGVLSRQRNPDLFFRVIASLSDTPAWLRQVL